MALQGTLDTFALPDVLRLLASTRKTGQLSVSTDRGDATLWLAQGELTVTRLGSDRDLPAVEVLFELLRGENGSFEFDTEKAGPTSKLRHQVDPLLDEADQMLREWREIMAVVPSRRSQLSLSSELEVDSVTIDRDGWRQLAAIAGGSTAEEFGARLDLDELPAARAVKALVEAGLVSVSEPVAQTVPVAPVAPSAEPTPTAPAWAAPAPVESVPDTPDAPEELIGEGSRVLPAEPEPASWGAESPPAIDDKREGSTVLASDLPEPLPGGQPLDRFAVFGDAPAPSVGAAPAIPPPPRPPPLLPTRGPTGTPAAPRKLPDDLAALSPDAARAVAAVMDQQAADTGDGETVAGAPPAEDTDGEAQERGRLLRLLGPKRG